MTLLDTLAPLRAHGGQRRTTGLDDATLLRFAATHPALVEAVDPAAAEYAAHTAPEAGDSAALLTGHSRVPLPPHRITG